MRARLYRPLKTIKHLFVQKKDVIDLTFLSLGDVPKGAV